jgi:hypothetical protein
MDLLAHAGDTGLYLLVPGVVFLAVYRMVRGPLSDEPKGTPRTAGQAEKVG